jgi:Cu/Ag efflux protein CusF
MKRILSTLVLSGALAVLIALPLGSPAQGAITHEKEPVIVKATIESIDHDTRMITFKDKEGKSWVVLAGPEVRRFAELKVGDVVTFHTTESVVYQIRKPGEAAAPSAKDEPAIVRTPGDKPGGTATQQETKVVTVKEVDQKTTAVTIQTEDGKTMSFKVSDSKLLKGLSPGDRVVITYTTAVAISVEAS